MKVKVCHCCQSEAKHAHTSSQSNVIIYRCTGCRSLLTEFTSATSGEDPWKMMSVTPSFLEALRYRRALQAASILETFQPFLTAGEVLDYGCGQGAFVQFLRSKGVLAKGCDISYSNLDTSALGDAFITLTEPWQIPDLSPFQLISFLDVIEHAEDPFVLVNKLKESKIRYVLIKVPMLNGPIGCMSQALALLNSWNFMERLLLVGEISPHYSFFSSKGVENLFQRGGFQLKKSHLLADVGSELPQRLRGKPGEPSIVLKDTIATVAGSAFSAIAPLWSDTKVFLFENKI